MTDHRLSDGMCYRGGCGRSEESVVASSRIVAWAMACVLVLVVCALLCAGGVR